MLVLLQIIKKMKRKSNDKTTFSMFSKKREKLKLMGSLKKDVKFRKGTQFMLRSIYGRKMVEFGGRGYL